MVYKRVSSVFILFHRVDVTGLPEGVQPKQFYARSTYLFR